MRIVKLKLTLTRSTFGMQIKKNVSKHIYLKILSGVTLTEMQKDLPLPLFGHRTTECFGGYFSHNASFYFCIFIFQWEMFLHNHIYMTA